MLFTRCRAVFTTKDKLRSTYTDNWVTHVIIDAVVTAGPIISAAIQPHERKGRSIKNGLRGTPFKIGTQTPNAAATTFEAFATNAG